MSNNHEINHLESIREDIRDEIKKRIEQRNRYSIQLTIALGALTAIAFSKSDRAMVLIAAPLVSIYFTMLILYSYRIHKICAQYMRDKLEPELARLCTSDPELEWETYYSRQRVKPGIRKKFFIFTLWAITILTWIYLYVQHTDKLASQNVVGILSLLYIIAVYTITRIFYKRKHKRAARDWPKKISHKYRRAVFLDRDGTINVDKHYTHKLEDLEFIAKATEGLKVLAQLPLHIIIVSNQAGIALGLFEKKDMSKLNKELRKLVEKEDGRIDAFYYCPHLEQKNLFYGEKPCDCSKPSPGMLIEAAKDYNLNLEKCYIVGDKTSDIAAGHNIGCYTILVETGKAGKEDNALSIEPHAKVSNLYEASLLIRKRIEEG